MWKFLGGFIMNNVRNIIVHDFWFHVFEFLLDIYQGLELLIHGEYIILCY
jgi:hypothetical protein